MKKLKNSVIILTGLLALASIAPVSVSAASTSRIEANMQVDQQFEVNSPEDYIAWLKGQDGSEKTLEQFSKLSEQEQEKFIEYINDPEVNKTVLDAMGSSNGDKVLLYGGDIVVKKSSITPGEISILQADYEVYQVATSTVFGVDLAQIRERVEYRVKGTPGNQVVSEVLNGGGVVDRYWVPAGRMDVKDDKGYVGSDNRAVQHSIFTSSFVHPKLGLTIGTHDFTVYGNIKGVLDDWKFVSN